MTKLVSKILRLLKLKPLSTDQEIAQRLQEAVKNLNDVRKEAARAGLHGYISPRKGDDYIWIRTFSDYDFKISLYRTNTEHLL